MVTSQAPRWLKVAALFTLIVIIGYFATAFPAIADPETQEECRWWEVGCTATNAVKTEVSGTLGKIIDMILALAVNLFGYLMDFFQRDPTASTDAISNSIEWVTDSTKSLVVYAIAFSIVLGAGKIAVSQLDQQLQQGSDTAKAAIRAAVVAAAGTPILLALITATDYLSTFFFQQAGDIAAAKNRISEMLITEESELTTERLLLLVVAVMAIFAFLDLLIQLFLRQFLFIAATVFLPIAGAATTSDQGREVWSATIRMLTGLLLFKPICALVFAIGIRFANESDASTGNDFTMVLLFIAPVLAMPILLQLVGGAGGSAGGGMMAAAGSAVMLRGGARIAKGALGKPAKAASWGGGAGKKSSQSGGGTSPGVSPVQSRGGGGQSGFGGTGGSGFGGGGGGGGAGSGKPPASLPPAMQHRSASSQPRTTPSVTPQKPSSTQPAAGSRGETSGGATSKGNSGTTTAPAAGSAGGSSGTTGGGSGGQSSPTPPSAPRGKTYAQHRDRLAQAWPMYQQQQVQPSKKNSVKGKPRG